MNGVQFVIVTACAVVGGLIGVSRGNATDTRSGARFLAGAVIGAVAFGAIWLWAASGDCPSGHYEYRAREGQSAERVCVP